VQTGALIVPAAVPPPVEANGGRRIALGQHVLTALPVGALVVAAWQTRWMSDDGFIHVRVARQVLAATVRCSTPGNGSKPARARCGWPC
jgi:hypothetical protein